MQTTFTSVPLAAALALAAAMPAYAAGFSDATVDPSGYTQLTFHTDPSVSVAVAAVGSGNPGAALALGYTNAGGPVNMVSMIGFINNAFSYDPGAQGALASVDFSNDRFVDGGDAFLNASLVTYSRALIAQGGHYYYAAIFDAGQPRQTWYTTAASGVTSAAFGLFDFTTGSFDATQHPDFSAGGGTLGFGFLNRFFLDTSGSPYALNATFGYDNIAVTLNAAPVPEPTSAALLLAGLGVAAFIARRRR